MAVVINGDFRLKRYPFWEMRGITSSEPLAVRSNGGSSVVAVLNPQRSDYRLKVWRGAQIGYADDEEFVVNGVTFYLSHKHRGFYQGTANGHHLRYALRGLPDEDEEEEDTYESGPYLDVCIETTFDSNELNRYGAWRGRVQDFPAWMEAREISITPPQTSGGWHCIMLDAPGISPHVDRTTVPTMRVNGIWMLAAPVVDEVASNGISRWGGRWQLLCDPDELEVVRGHGQDGAIIDIANEPVRPRSRYAIRSLHLMVGLSRGDQWMWEESIRTLSRTVMGMAACQGQADVYDSSRRRYAARGAHYARVIANRYRRGRADGKTLEKWLDETDDSDVKSWSGSEKLYRKAMADAATRGAEMSVRVMEMRRQHDEALSKIEDFEERYSDAIEQLYPDIE